MLRPKISIKDGLCLLLVIISFGLVVRFYYPLNSLINEEDFVLDERAPIIYPYIAMIIDNRKTSQLVTAVLNILEHIPSDWKIQIFTLDEHWPFYQRSSLASFIRTNRIFMTPIDFSHRDLPDQDFINLYLTSPSLWHRVRGEKVLFFQTDSVICSNSSYKLTDFLHYDFIGAPRQKGGCSNGGFSIRTRSKTLSLLESSRGEFPLHGLNEDDCFSTNLRQFGGFVAPIRIAKTFAMESIYHPRAFAVHKSRDARPAKKIVLRVCAECAEAKRLFSECG